MTDRIDTAKEREKLAALEDHTPGPWRKNPRGWVAGATNLGLARVAIIDDGAGCFPEENAKLIATAPDLKATLAAALDALDAKDAEIQILEDKLQTAQTDAEFFQSEVKLRNRIPGSSQELADLLREVEKAKQDIVAKDAAIERLQKALEKIRYWDWQVAEPHGADIPENVEPWARELDDACTQMQRIARAALNPEDHK